MKTKSLCLIAVFLIAASAWGQTGNEDYWIDENGRFHQMIRWTPSGDVGFYDVEVDKRDNEGEWQPVLNSRADYDADSLEVMLPPGTYRFRILSYNVIGKLAATGDWTPMRVYRAVTPRAEQPAGPVEIPRGDAEFTLTLYGEDLDEEAEVYLVPARSGAAPIQPVKMDYSYDDTWIAASFPSSAVKNGKYDAVITNPGGLSQTVSGIQLKFVRARRTAGPYVPTGPFDLSNTKNWGLGGGGAVYLQQEDTIDVDNGFSASGFFRYTFYEQYKEYGTFFFLPNSFFLDARFHYGIRNSNYHESNGQTDYTNDKKYYGGYLDLGFLYKVRLGSGQRFILNFGFSIGPGYAKYDETRNNPYDEENDISAFALFINIEAGLSFRFTPVWSLDFGLAYGGTVINPGGDDGSDGGGGPGAGIGVTYRIPYGERAQSAQEPQKAEKAEKIGSTGPFDLDNTKNWSLGAEGHYGKHEDFTGTYYGGSIRWTFLEMYREYGYWSWLKLLPNAFFAEAAYDHQEYNGHNNEIERDVGVLMPGFLWKLRLDQSQRWLLDFGMGAGYAGGQEYVFDSHGDTYDGPYTGIYMELTGRLAFRVTPSWEIKLGLDYAGAPVTMQGKGGWDGRIQASLGAAYRRGW
jgi:hypothetical protein